MTIEAFQPTAFQNDAFQIGESECVPGFQSDAFQNDAFQVCVEDDVAATRPRPDDGPRHNRIFKPTGLDGYRKPVEARIEQSHEVALEVAGVLAREFTDEAPKLVFPHVSLTDLRDKHGNRLEISPDDELAIMILIAASV
jgi:hypothetical protein